MKLTKQQAEAEAKRRTLPHKAAPTRYWSVDEWRWIPCWTVILEAK